MQADYDDARAVAQLPNLDIEILHRRPWRGDGEMLSITLRAKPSFVTLQLRWFRCRGICPPGCLFRKALLSP